MQKTGFPANSRMIFFIKEDKQNIRIAINVDRIDAVIDGGDSTKIVVGGKDFFVMVKFNEVMFMIEAVGLQNIIDKTRLLIKWELKDREDLIFGKKEVQHEQG